jgi:hypothetical protein
MKLTSSGCVMALALAVVAAGCASRSAGSRPDDMSAQQHEATASQHDAAAKAHAEEYDPGASRLRSSVKAGVEQTYNPTEGHRDTAAEHRAHAEQHRAAARELEAFEDQACKGLPPGSHAACPLLESGLTWSATPTGIRLTPSAGVTASDLVNRIRCHQAFARTVKGDGMAECPFYVPNSRVSVSADGRTVELVGDDPAAVAALQQRASR